MLLGQWGLTAELASDPAVWLCHQCNDCSERCPRDAKPGDVMQVLRGLAVEALATPPFLGKLVGKVKTTWPIVVGLPILFWALLAWIATGFNTVPPEGRDFGYGVLAPTLLVDAIFVPAAAWVVFSCFRSGTRFWKLLGSSGAPRQGTFLSNLLPAILEVFSHRRFGSCGTAAPRKLGHLILFWGFAAAFATTLLAMGYEWVPKLIPALGLETHLPIPLAHPFKILGNISAVLLVVGIVMLIGGRMTGDNSAGRTSAFDRFFLAIIGLVIASGVLAEVLRLGDAVTLGCAVYIIHLGTVLCMFLTVPYSKFAHILYRTLAMVHERMAGPVQPKQ
jgi:quinone-modifying oxidoreductase, subunit QmoC